MGEVSIQRRIKFMKKLNIKSLIVGGIIGASLMFSVQSFAAGGDIVQAVFAQFNLVINGQTKTMETVPLVYNGTSYLPVRDISNLFGYDVTYKSDSRTIVLNSTVGGNVYGNPTSTVTPTPSPQPTVTPSPSPTTVADVGDNQVYYSARDFSQKFDVRGTVIDNSPAFIHNEIKYKADAKTNYYYDKTNDYIYCSANFLLQFLSQSDLDGLVKYHIDRINKVVTNIQ
jgi:hypothetical protein